MKTLITACLVFTLCASLAAAQIYKWRDQNGKLVFSDSPPARGQNATTLETSVQTPGSVISDRKPSRTTTTDSIDLYRSNRAGELFPSNGYVPDEVQNAREYLGLLSSKSSLNSQDIMMVDYIRFVFEQPEAKPYLGYGDSTSARSLGRRGDAAKRSLSARERDIVDKSMQMMVARWKSETYRELSDVETGRLDSILQRLWSEMCMAMADGNIDKTISFFHSSTQSVYRRQLEAFTRVDLQRLAKDMSQQIQFVKDHGGLIEYSLRTRRNGQESSHLVNFQAENNGQWKIRQF